ncbi:MAG: class I SAM-dependent methyltransferase [Saprospiraceae bacterium]
MDKSERQSEIKSWFDNMYNRRGEYYLRPVKAYYIFLELLKANQSHKLLDVACGLGRLLEAGKEYGCDLSGIDISSVAVQKAQKKLPSAKIKVANAETLPFQNSSFDLITCLGSLERMIDLDLVLKELYRVGSDSARYCFLVRNSNTVSWKYIKKGLGLKNDAGHQGANSLQGWKDIFKNEKFNVLEVWPDQYPIFKKNKYLTLGLKKINYKVPIREKKTLEESNEFIFILDKNV